MSLLLYNRMKRDEGKHKSASSEAGLGLAQFEYDVALCQKL